MCSFMLYLCLIFQPILHYDFVFGKRESLRRFVVEDGAKPAIFGSYSYDPVKQVFVPPPPEKSNNNIPHKKIIDYEQETNPHDKFPGDSKLKPQHPHEDDSHKPNDITNKLDNTHKQDDNTNKHVDNTNNHNGNDNNHDGDAKKHDENNNKHDDNTNKFEDNNYKHDDNSHKHDNDKHDINSDSKAISTVGVTAVKFLRKQVGPNRGKGMQSFSTIPRYHMDKKEMFRIRIT